MKQGFFFEFMKLLPKNVILKPLVAGVITADSDFFVFGVERVIHLDGTSHLFQAPRAGDNGAAAIALAAATAPAAAATTPTTAATTAAAATAAAAVTAAMLSKPIRVWL